MRLQSHRISLLIVFEKSHAVKRGAGRTIRAALLRSKRTEPSRHQIGRRNSSLLFRCAL